jgi:DNA adenine methylase
VKSPLPYIGGKSRLAKTIVDQIPEHTTYAEVFAGAGWVFFRKEPSRYEVLNDFNSDLVSFYRVLQNHLEEFCKQFRFLLVSREWFKDWSRQLAADGLTDVQRAARFYYVQRLGFAGKVVGRVFGKSVAGLPRINLLRMEEELSEVHLRLTRVTIENLPWSVFLARYDRAETFFYLDPPYWGCEEFYGKDFHREDFEKMAEQLKSLKGSFLLSLNDVPEVRRIFSGFTQMEVRTAYSAAVDRIKPVSELLIKNF